MMNDYEINISPILTRQLFKELVMKILEEDCISDPDNPYDKLLLFADGDSMEIRNSLPEQGNGFYLTDDESSNPPCYRAYIWNGESWKYVDSLQGYEKLDKVVDIWWVNGGFNEF